MECAQLLAIFEFFLVFGLSVSQTNRRYKICSRVNNQVIVACGPDEFIYIDRTTLSDWPGIPGTDCDLPLCSQYCHVYSDRASPIYNGQQMAQYTFVSEHLSQYTASYGHCNSSSMSKIVHIVYECLPADATNSICSDTIVKGNVDGHILSPGFPGGVETKKRVGCQCDLSATNDGTISLMGVLINPMVDDSVHKWTLSAVNDLGDRLHLGIQPDLTTTLAVSTTTKLRLTYSSSGDMSGDQLFYPNYPGGFWIKYSAFPSYSKIDMQCSELPEEDGLSPVGIGIVCCVTVIFILLISTLIYFGRKWYKRGETGQQHTETDGKGQNNYATDIDFACDNATDEFVWNSNKYETLPELFHAQQFKQFRLVEVDSKNLKQDRQKKTSTISTASNSSMDVSIIKLESRESRGFGENDDGTGSFTTFASFDIKVLHLDGITDSEVDV